MYTPLDQIPDLELFKHGSGKYEIKNLEGPITLTCWRGFQSRLEANNAFGSIHPSDGSGRITIGGDMISEDPAVQSFHVNAYNYLMEFQAMVQDRILQALLADYKGLQEMYGYDKNQAATIMPDVNDVQEFKKLIGLSAVHLLNVSKEDIGYVGYEFGCTWDLEHGLGIMTWKDNIIELGDASTAFLTWIADKDRDPNNENSDSIFNSLLEQDELIASKKPWWKFW